MEKTFREAEEWARNNTSIIEEFLSSRDYIISFSGRGRIPALVFSWIKSLVLGKPPSIYESNLITYHLLPYIEKTVIIHFASRGDESTLPRMLDTAYLTGSELVVVSPPLHKRLVEKLHGFKTIIVPGDLDYVIASSMLALKAGFSQSLKTSGRSDKRVSRLSVEVDDISIVAHDLYEHYRDKILQAIDKLMKTETIVLAYTPTMEAPAWLLEQICTGILGKKTPVYPVSALAERISSGELIVLFSTMVEEDSLREIRFKSLQRGSQLVEFNINTDPATAQIYGLMIAKYLEAYLETQGITQRLQSLGPGHFSHQSG